MLCEYAPSSDQNEYDITPFHKWLGQATTTSTFTDNIS